MTTSSGFVFIPNTLNDIEVNEVGA